MNRKLVMIGKKQLLTVLIFTPLALQAAPFFARNTVRPYDRLLWPDGQEPGSWQLMMYADDCFHEKGVQCDHTKTCDVLQIYDCNQNTLAMIRGFESTTPVGQLATRLNTVSDDGTRGHVVPYGAFHMAEFGIGAQYWLIHDLYVGLYVPFIHMKLDNVSWCDCTKQVNEQDYLTKDLLTSNLCKHVCDFGCLNACSGWNRTGIGDMSLLMGWEREFPQPKPILTKVRLSVFGGASLPTGAPTNEDQLFSMPMGYDRAPGLIFGGRLKLTWKHHFVGGVDADFIQLFGNTRCRRIRTDNNQSDLLLLAKAPMHIDWGFIQRYHLYLGGYDLVRGFSCNVGYLFQQQGDSTASLCGNEYITSIAQSAQSLREWTIHTITLDALYNWDFDLAANAPFVPRISLFYQHDFRGRRAILLDKFGVTFGFSF